MMKLDSRIRCCQRWLVVMRVIMGFSMRRRAAALLRQMMALCANMAPITSTISTM